MASSIKMDELLVKWLGSDTVFENVDKLVHSFQSVAENKLTQAEQLQQEQAEEAASTDSPRGVIPPFYPKRERRQRFTQSKAAEEGSYWLLPAAGGGPCVRDRVKQLFTELDVNELVLENFGRITKEVCQFPSFFNGPLFQRILSEWNAAKKQAQEAISQPMLEWFWMRDMEKFDAPERFFRLIKQAENDYVGRDDFLPYIKELLNDHPVRTVCIEFTGCHVLALTLSYCITRLFY